MRNVVALLEGQNRTLISAVTDARTIDRRPYNEWLFEQDKKLDVVDSFCYLGDTIIAGVGCDLSVIMRVWSAWGKFREFLPVLTSRALSYTTPGQTYSTHILPVLLYVSECLTPSVNDLLNWKVIILLWFGGYVMCVGKTAY